MNETSPTRRPAWVVAVAAAVVATSWLFFLSGWIGVEPGRVLAERRDVLFNSDAGERIADVQRGTGSFGYGSHALVNILWPKVLNRAIRFAADRDAAAVVVTRAVVAFGAGLGLGTLAGGLVFAGVPWRFLAVIAPIFLLATSNAIACLPDHFGLSLGILAAAFGVYIVIRTGRGGRGAKAGLLGLGVLAGGVCLTNAIFPLALWASLRARTWKPDWSLRHDIRAAGIFLVAFLAVVTMLPYVPDDLPGLWQAKFWLHHRVVNDPTDAAARAVTGPVAAVVGPAPLTNQANYFHRPMVTYEQENGRSRPWAYDAIGSAAALTWLGLMLVATTRGLRSLETRGPILTLAAWIAWNALFHNTWGDEYFLYSPHYGWAAVVLVALGLCDVRIRFLIPAFLVIALVQIRTLLSLRDAVAAIAS